MNFKQFTETLKGGQHKLDKNKNGKLDSHDFKMLRKEETDLQESHFELGQMVKCKDSGMKGKIIKLDKPDAPDDEKYYTVKREDGKTVKYAPNELTAIKESVEIEEAGPYYNKPSFIKKMSQMAKQERMERERKEKEQQQKPKNEQAPVAPVPDRKYIKGTKEYKEYMATKKPRTGHPTNEEVDLDEELTSDQIQKHKQLAAKHRAIAKSSGGDERVAHQRAANLHAGAINNPWHKKGSSDAHSASKKLGVTEEVDESIASTIGGAIGQYTGSKIGMDGPGRAHGELAGRMIDYHARKLVNKLLGKNKTNVRKEEVEIDEGKYGAFRIGPKRPKYPHVPQGDKDPRTGLPLGFSPPKKTNEESELDEATPNRQQVKQGIGIARDKRYAGGNMTGAVKAMDKLNKGLAQHPVVKKELQKQNEEVEELDELSKGTLASYAKKATHDARIKHGIGKDFERISNSSRKPEYKQGAKEWETKYKSDARKREAGVGKAIDRLAKEEVELDEVLDSPGKFMSYTTKAAASGLKSAVMGTGKFRKRQAGIQRAVDKTKAKINNEELESTMKTEEVELDEKMDMKKADMGDVIKDFQKSDAPQFAGKSQEKRREMAIAAKLEADRMKKESVMSFGSYIKELDMNLLRAAQKGAKEKPNPKDPESERNRNKPYGYRNDHKDFDDESDDKPKAPAGEKRGRGRPPGSKNR